MKANTILTASLSLILLTTVSCSQLPVNTITNIQHKNIKVPPIHGIAQFPTHNKGLSTKASLEEVGVSATVSILYSPDHPTQANKTVATGLTDSNGLFRIFPNDSFIPVDGEIFILEGQKRIGGVSNEVITIRTYIKWVEATGIWDSMTFSNNPADGTLVFINSKTTALAILQAFNTSTISSASTIRTIDVTSGTSVPSDIGTSPNILTHTTILNVADLVI